MATTTTATISGGSTDLTNDFGFDTPSTTASIGDYVWNDIDGDGYFKIRLRQELKKVVTVYLIRSIYR